MSTRYTYTKEPLPRQDAIALKEAEILGCRARVRLAEEELLEAITRPLQKTRTIQHAFEPGDPGYEVAPERFDPTKYQGDLR